MFMELLIIFLMILPGIGYLLEKFGIGKSYQKELLLPIISADEVRSYLFDFTRTHQWSLLYEELTNEKILYVFQAGQWGNSRYGSQKVTISFFPSDQEIRCFIQSSSLFGQIYDFGANQNNVESLSLYFTEISKENADERALHKSGSFIIRQLPIDPKYWIVLFTLLLFVIGVKFIYTKSREVVPGRVQITFQKYVSVDIATKLLTDFGGLNCFTYDPKNLNAYECEVPIGDEETIANKAHENPVVQIAQPKYK